MKKKYIILLSFLIGIIFLISFIILGPKKIYFNLKGKIYNELNIGDVFKDQGVSAEYCNKYIKLFCKDLSDKVKVSKHEEKSKNKYYLNYNIIYGRYKKTLSREVKFVDNESPTIKLVNSEKNICPNQEYIEEGYTAYDNVDGDITNKVVKEIKDGNVYYSVLDSSNNKRTVIRNIHYQDNEKPNINLVGGNTVYVYNGTEYKDRGYNAVDNCDGDMTDKISVNNNVDTNKDGEYNVTYSVVDTFGNKNTISRKVVVYSDISKVPKNGKVIYLTFDDGPGIYTQSILDVLNEYNVKATFFVTNQFSNYHYMIKKEYETGHSIAVHTYSHNYGKIYESVDSYVEDFNQMNQIILDETGTYTKMFRFPGGSSNTISKFNKGVVSDIAKTMNEKGYIYFDWNVDSIDTKYKDPEIIYQNVINEIEKHDYSVVLMHDIKKANIESVRKIIIFGLENGYTFLGLDENSPEVHHHINN